MGDTSGFFSSAGSFLQEAAPYVAAGATIAGAALPLFIQDDEVTVSAYQPTTTQTIEADNLAAEAAKKAEQRRRELARRRGFQSTIRTPLGVTTDFGIRREDIVGV